MKFTHCYIHQFGKLREKQFDFDDGITVIRGDNESGKTTLQTALAVFLFGLERGRGRAAAGDLYKKHLPWKDPSLYGGELDLERDGKQIHIERDLTVTPPRSYILETQGPTTREITASEMPWPPALSPFVFYNTLSFRQPGGATAGGLADELKSHIANLQGSGNENLDVAAALQTLRRQRSRLEKSLNTAAELSEKELEKEFAKLENQPEETPAGSWDALKEEIEVRENETSRLTDARSRTLLSIRKRKKALEETGIAGEAQARAERDAAAEIEKNAAIYERDYAGSRIGDAALSALSFLLFIPLLFCFWLALRGYLDKQWFFIPGLIGLIIAAVAEIRVARRMDALEAHRANGKILKQLLHKYLPEYTPEGTAEEAGQLKDYLTKVVQQFARLDEQEKEAAQQTERLIALAAEQKSLAGRLETEMSGQIRRERTAAQLRELTDEKEALAPILKENARIRKEIEAVDLALTTLEELSGTVYSDFGEPLTRIASDIFQEITGGYYDGLRVDEKLQLFAVKEHRLITPGALSGGAAEQLYMAFRLAVIRFLWPDEPMPLLFDESFAFYDRDRLLALLRWLYEHYRGQVLLFTCQDREETLLTEAGIPYQRLLLDNDG